MTKQSDAVKKWRRKTKDRILEAFGGACTMCGYNRCSASLCLHHLDPSKKEFSFGGVRASAKSWSALVVEMRKCVMVCNNCHGEIHAGITHVPKLARRFNEAFTNYKEVERRKKYTPCVQCGVNKESSNKYCNVKCAAKAREKVDWFYIDLQESLKTKSKSQIAKELGVSEAAVRKRLRKLQGNENCGSK